MTSRAQRSRVGRPYRHLRRWVRHTSNQEIALSLIWVGVALIAAAIIVAIVAL